MKEIYRLSEFERGDFYFFSNKIVLNETIYLFFRYWMIQFMKV